MVLNIYSLPLSRIAIENRATTRRIVTSFRGTYDRKCGAAKLRVGQHQRGAVGPCDYEVRDGATVPKGAYAWRGLSINLTRLSREVARHRR